MLTAKSSEVIQFKPKPSNGQHFAMIRDSLQLSPAWQNLPPGPAKLYVAMAGIYNGHNNGRIRLSVRDAAKLVKKSESTVSRWLNHLEKAGLAVRTKRGSFNPHTKTAWSSLWALTEWMSDEERKACSSTCKNESPASPSTCTSESGWTCMDETNLIDKKDNKLRIDKISKIDSSFSESQSQEESGEARGPSAPKEGREESKQVKKASAAPSGAIAPSPASSSSSSLTPPPPVPRAPRPHQLRVSRRRRSWASSRAPSQVAASVPRSIRSSFSLQGGRLQLRRQMMGAWCCLEMNLIGSRIGVLRPAAASLKRMPRAASRCRTHFGSSISSGRTCTPKSAA
jgi:hypothetical protein